MRSLLLSWKSLLFALPTALAVLEACGGDSTGSSTLGATCGGERGTTCADGEYCAYTAGQNCGRTDATAICKARPDVCPAIYAPVCGCDGRTHSSACAAAAAGVGYEHDGPCEGGQTCAGLHGSMCPDGLFCFMDPGQCLVSDASGTCLTAPQACDDVLARVCGCDGKTYDNACFAALAGINVQSDGACAAR